MIYVVCKYEGWARYWFNEIARLCPAENVKDRHMKIKLRDGKIVQFIGEHRFDSAIHPKPDDNVIYFDDTSTITDLEVLIERNI